MPLKKLKKLKKSYFCKIIIACVPYSYGCGYLGIGLSAACGRVTSNLANDEG